MGRLGGALIALLFVSVSSYASGLQIRMQVRNVANFPDKSVVWNPLHQEATVRMSLVPVQMDPSLAGLNFSLTKASHVDMTAMTASNLSAGCTEVTDWNFEYIPGLPDYLMYLTFKGLSCEALAENLDVVGTRLRFEGISVMQVPDPVDVTVEISR